MARSQETFNKKNVRNKKEKKRKEKEKRKLEKREEDTKDFDDMIAYVNEFGEISSTPFEDQKNAPKDVNKDKFEGKEDLVVEADDTNTGIIDYYNDDKGFGFIIEKGTKRKLFVHINDSKSKLKEGNKVKFTPLKEKKGWVAKEVEIVKEEKA